MQKTIIVVQSENIPNQGQQLTRYLGRYSSQSRGLRKKAAQMAVTLQTTAKKKRDKRLDFCLPLSR
jgi:hypothetical protein